MSYFVILYYSYYISDVKQSRRNSNYWGQTIKADVGFFHCYQCQNHSKSLKGNFKSKRENPVSWLVHGAQLPLPVPRKEMSHGHKKTQINKIKFYFFLTQPRYTADHPALLFPIGLSQTMSYSCGWWPRKRHSACDLLLPALHAALMGNEPALAFLKRKTKAAFNQRTIICYWTSGRHIQQCYSTAVAVVIGRKSDVLLGLLKSEHKRKGVWWKHLYNVYVML